MWPGIPFRAIFPINIFQMKDSFLSNIDSKNSTLKKKIIRLCINEGDYSIAELSKELNSSIPTITKLVGELIDAGFLEDLGKSGTAGGRKPSIFGLNPSAGYFVGTDIQKRHVSIAIANFKGKILDFQEDIPYTLENSEESVSGLCDLIRHQLRQTGMESGEVLSYGFNLTGRVNYLTGYSFSYFISEDKPLTSILEERMGAPIFIENDSRAMTYGEYICGVAKNEKNMLFLNVSWGLGMIVHEEPELSGRAVSRGTYGWSGAYGTHFFIDPVKKISAVMMMSVSNIGGADSPIAAEFERCVEESTGEK